MTAPATAPPQKMEVSKIHTPQVLLGTRKKSTEEANDLYGHLPDSLQRADVPEEPKIIKESL